MSTSPKMKTINTTTNKPLREPPPSLFLGPPSQNASHVSLPGVPNAPSGATGSSNNPVTRGGPQHLLSHQRSQRLAGPSGTGLDGASAATSAAGPAGAGGGGSGGGGGSDGAAPATGPPLPPAPPLSRTPLPRLQSEGQKQADRTDALWAEMQSTLEDVELSATNGTHVFGPEHGRALEDLRAAQIALAQAWARSEADEAGDAADGRENRARTAAAAAAAAGHGGSEGRSALDGGGANTEGGGVGGGRSTAPSGSGRPGSSGGGGGAGGGGAGPGTGTGVGERLRSTLEEATDKDILLARMRREANDKYFQRVNGGVLDVVAKLEEVAVAMRAVEQETRDLWGESENETGSIV